MLPVFLFGTYKQYKEDTDSIATWLAQTAKRCGFASDLLSGDAQKPVQKPAKSKAKSKKKARDAARRVPAEKRQHIIPIKEFLSLANYIASYNKPPVDVPLAFLNNVSRAVAARRKSNDYFKASEESDLEAGDGHEHFIGVLEEVYDILRLRCTSGVAADRPAQPQLHGTPIGSATETAKLENLFENLHVEEPSEEFLSAPDVALEAKPEPAINYQAEPMEGRQKLYFASYSLFTDIDQLLGYLRELWVRYKDGELDLITASITSNTAIDLVRRLEQDFVKEFPEAADTEFFINMIYQVKCIVQGRQPEALSREKELAPFNMQMYDTAQWLLMPTLTILSSFAAIVDPNHIPIYKPGHYGTYDPRSNRANKSNAGKFLEDKIILLEALPDFCFLSKIRGTFPAEDELTRGLRNMMTTGKLNLWTVFAAQVFLDIHHILRADISVAFVQLQRLGLQAKKTTGETLTFRDGLRVDTWPAQNDQALYQNVIRKIDDFVLEDQIHAMMKRLVKGVPLPEGKFRLYNQHPMLCGLFAFSIQLQLQEYGITYVNAWGSAMYTAHLYNALRQEGYCAQEWPDMELLIQLHTPERLFVGGAPTKTEDYLKRFSLSMGYSVSQYAANRRNRGAVASPQGPRGLYEISPVSQIFKRRYCDNAATHDLSLENVETLLNERFEAAVPTDASAGAAEVAPSTEGERSMKGHSVKVATVSLMRKSETTARANMRKRFQKTNKLSPVELLLALQVSMDEEIPELYFDYFAFHRTCWTVLRTVQQFLHPLLLKYYETGYLERENQLPFTVGYIFMTASQSQEAARSLGMLRLREGVQVSNRVLQEAGKVLQEFLEGEAGQKNGAEQLRIIAGRGRGFAEIGSMQYMLDMARAVGLGSYEIVPEAERPRS